MEDEIERRKHTEGIDQPDPAKAMALRYIAQALFGEIAEWRSLSNGDIHLRFSDGAAFILDDKGITRIVDDAKLLS